MKDFCEKSIRIRIFQPIVPEYRVALFDGLAELYPGRIEVWASPNMGCDVSYPLKKMAYDYKHKFLRIGPLVWQRGFSLAGLSRGDVIVICGDIHQLSSLVIAIKAKLRGVKVVWWGHHWTANGKMLRVRIRLAIAKMLSDVYLCYTRTGISFLEGFGFARENLFATGNTINQAPILEAMRHWSQDRLAKFVQEKQLVGRNLILICSVLRPKVKLFTLFKAMSEKCIREHKVLLAVIGEGPEKEKCQALADEYGIGDMILWIGATRDQNVMAPWFLTAKAFVYPGSIGLSILHSLSYGLPVIVHGNADHQMPEFEIMEEGNTGLLFRENDVKDLAAKIVWAVEHPNQMKRMGEYSKDKAWKAYSMNAMIANYSAAIERCIQLSANPS